MPASLTRFSASGIFKSPETSFGSKVSLNSVRIIFSSKFESIFLNMSEVESENSSDPDRVDKSIRDFLSLKNDKKAKNDKSPKDSVDPFNPSKMKFGLRK